MKESLATVTTKGQVTIPSAVRRRMDIKAGDKVVFVVGDDGLVQIRPVQHTLASIRGIVPPLPGRKSTDFEDQIEEAMEEEVEFERLLGSIPPVPGRETVDLETIAKEAMDAEADEIVREMGGL